MAGHMLYHFELGAILKVGGDAGGAEAVGLTLVAQTSCFGPPLDHQVHIELVQGNASGQLIVAQG